MLYQLLKDFAGPVATVIAAATAAVFIRRQAKTADRQARTALDQLRYNLFERRYAIYLDVQAMITLLINEASRENFDARRLAPHYLVLDEAHFFFSDHVCGWLAELRKECEDLTSAQAVGPRRDPVDIADRIHLLTRRWREMPKVFGSELQFRQLTERAVTGRDP